EFDGTGFGVALGPDDNLYVGGHDVDGVGTVWPIDAAGTAMMPIQGGPFLPDGGFLYDLLYEGPLRLQMVGQYSTGMTTAGFYQLSENLTSTSFDIVLGSDNEALAVARDPLTSLDWVVGYADPGGGWVGTGVRVDSTSGTFFPFFLRVDFSGTPVWLTKPDYPGAISSAAWAAARQPLPDATFLFEETLLQHGGLPLLDTRDRVGAVQKLDGQGQLLCTEMFGQGHAAAFLGGAATADGGAIAVGSGIFNQSRDVFLVKVGPDCAVGFMTPLQAPFEVILSPNPSPGDLAIRLSGEAHGEVEFRVFKADGTPILSGSGEKSAGVDWQQQCSLAQLPKGAYFIWVKVGQQARTQSWIKTGW
ncbi:MAG TPA: T9SS type A sorting domain-containing protein, partial [Saprospiraceae bacterium]|nr:T9SS type A sorting domain-containing protein [Saprospiraceae bacterium]